MAEIRAFKALRPAAEFAAKVAAPPYDVMSSGEARDMVKDNPLSFLRVDKAEVDFDAGFNPYDDAVYAKAAENLNKLVSNGVLVEDAEPCFYVYRLVMDGKEQTGLAVCCSVNEYIDGRIKRHELTREDKERDRIRHVETCSAHTGPIFMAYRQNAVIDAVINLWVAESEPVYDFVANDGVTHTVWVVDDDAVIAKLRELFAQKVPALYIADGHHRNASAVQAAKNLRTAKKTENAEYDFYLAVLFPSEQLRIMDYNRVVKGLNGLTEKQFIEKISEKFVVGPMVGEKPDKRHTFGMYLGGKWYALIAKPEIIDENDVIASLDVSILQNNLLAPILGITDPRTDKNIDFVGGGRGVLELKRRVDSGEMSVAFAMFPTSMEELLAVADDEKIMPPKSTWFEPKLRSGLLVHRF